MRYLILFLTVFTLAHASQAAEPLPGAGCTTAGSTIASNNSGVGHFMVCQGGTWKSVYSYNATGNLTKIGNLTCATDEILKYNGTTWACASDNAGSGSSIWSLNGVKAYYNAGNVGVGTNNPSAKLAIASAGAAPDALLTVINGSSNLTMAKTTTGQYNPMSANGISLVFDNDGSNTTATGGLAIIPWSSSSYGMYIGENGRVGIGTNTPRETLSVGPYMNFHNGGTKALLFNSYWDGSAFQNDSLGAYSAGVFMDAVTGNIHLTAGTTADPWSYTNRGHVVVKASNGNVGIGTDAPGYKLDVNGNFNANGIATLSNAIGSTGVGGLTLKIPGWNAIGMDGSGSTKSLVMHYGGNTDNALRFGRYADNFGAWEANPIYFDMDAPTNSLVMDGNGSLQVRADVWHKSSDGKDRLYYGANHATYFKVGGAGASFVFRNSDNVDKAYISGSDGNIWMAWLGDWLGNKINQDVRYDSQPRFSRIYDNNTSYYIDSDYNSMMNVIYANIYYHHSDRRLKKNIKDLDSSDMYKLYELVPKRFDWKETGKHDIGFIAQDVEKLFPEIVSEDDKGMKGVEYSNIIPLLVAAVKDQRSEISGYKAEIASYKKRLDAIEARLGIQDGNMDSISAGKTQAASAPPVSKVPKRDLSKLPAPKDIKDCARPPVPACLNDKGALQAECMPQMFSYVYGAKIYGLCARNFKKEVDAFSAEYMKTIKAAEAQGYALGDTDLENIGDSHILGFENMMRAKASVPIATPPVPESGAAGGQQKGQ